MSSIPSKAVTQEQHDAVMAEVLKESPDFIIVREAPAGDVRRAEELLGLAEGKLDNIVLRFGKGDERCLGCGRQFNVLDLITAALKIHSSNFIKDIMFGDTIIGMTANNNKAPVCAACGQGGPGPLIAYTSQTYHWYDEDRIEESRMPRLEEWVGQGIRAVLFYLASRSVAAVEFSSLFISRSIGALPL